MRPDGDEPDGSLRTPDIDTDGVDRAQIRAMLALAPVERLRRMEEYVESAIRIRELNEERPLR